MENAKEVAAKFKRRMNMKVRRQEKLEIVEERKFMRGELSGKYIVKILYRWDDRKFKKECLKKLERNW